MAMRVESQEIPEGLDDDDGAGDRILVRKKDRSLPTSLSRSWEITGVHPITKRISRLKNHLLAIILSLLKTECRAVAATKFADFQPLHNY
jgi:hypothetical protein